MKKYFRRILSAALAILVLTAAAVSVHAFSVESVPTEQEVYDAIMAMQADYPEGMSWTNANTYFWHGGIIVLGAGCVGFALLLSDAAFGNFPARMIAPVDYSSLRVGDIVRINNDTHTVILLEVHTNYVVVAEGNYNYTIHWGRHIDRSEIEAGSFVYTRWPDGIHNYLGDVDGNFEINSLDALLALRYSLDLIDLSSEQIIAADVTEDGAVTTMDALLIHRKALYMTSY